MRSLLTCLVLLPIVAGLGSAPVSRLRVTQRDLVPICLNDQAVRSGTRSWGLEPGPVSLALSMRVNPRPGQIAIDPGIAAVTFTAEADHRYEVEVRAEPMVFSTRAWTAREWTPVVRDRTTDRVVSSEPRWVDKPCGEVSKRLDDDYAGAATVGSNGIDSDASPPQPSSASSRVTSPSS